jgi:hypothetical protein
MAASSAAAAEKDRAQPVETLDQGPTGAADTGDLVGVPTRSSQHPDGKPLLFLAHDIGSSVPDDATDPDATRVGWKQATTGYKKASDDTLCYKDTRSCLSNWTTNTIQRPTVVKAKWWKQ